MGSARSHLLDERARNQACIHEYEHVWTDLREQAVGSMHFRDIIAVHPQSHHRMAATLGQQHTLHLGIGSWPILVTAAPKGGRVGSRIRDMEQGAIKGQEPIASKVHVGHACRRCQQLTAFLLVVCQVGAFLSAFPFFLP